MTILQELDQYILTIRSFGETHPKFRFRRLTFIFFSAALLDTPNQSRTANEIYQAIEDKVKESSHALPGIQ